MLRLARVRHRVNQLMFWYQAGLGPRDRARFLSCWLSWRGSRGPAGAAVPIRTRYVPGHPVYIRSRSPDARVFRNLFLRRDYLLPHDLTGPVAQIVDVGAYTGLSTIFLGLRYPNAAILAVEPDAANAATLRLNTGRLEGRVRRWEGCVSNRSGTERFAAHGAPWERTITDGPGVTVPSLTLADLCLRFDLGVVDILKLDIEGAERLLFESFERWTSMVRWILMELHTAYFPLDALVRQVRACGRTPYLRSPDGRLLPVDTGATVRRFEGDVHLRFVIPPAGSGRIAAWA